MPLKDVLDFFRANPDLRFAVTGHQRPDGDSLGSSLGLAAILRNAGYRARAVNIAPIPDRLRFLLPDSFGEGETPEWSDDFDCLVVLDCGEWNRLDPANRTAEGRLKVVTIDHHESSAGMGEAVWIEPWASSVGEMIVRLAQSNEWEIPPDAAQALWVAIVTDTGRFSYENTSVAAVEAAGVCLASGADPGLAARMIYQSFTRHERALQAKALTRTEYHEDGRLAATWLLRRDFIEAGCGIEAAQDMINLLRDTAGVEISLFLCELPTRESDQTPRVKASIRTVDPHDAIHVAAQFGGGGHRRAAGCSFEVPLDEAKHRILAAARRAYFDFSGETRKR